MQFGISNGQREINRVKALRAAAEGVEKFAYWPIKLPSGVWIWWEKYALVGEFDRVPYRHRLDFEKWVPYAWNDPKLPNEIENAIESVRIFYPWVFKDGVNL